MNNLKTAQGEISFKIAKRREEMETASVLMQEYAAAMHLDLSSQHFDRELDSLQTLYGPPHGRLVLVFVHNKVAGCVAFRRLNESIAELKRMYVRADYRGLGLGKALLNHAILLARDAGY